MIIPHPVCPLLPGCPLEHLRVYGLDRYAYFALERELGEHATVGDVLKRVGDLTEIRGVGRVRAAEILRVLEDGCIWERD